MAVNSQKLLPGSSGTALVKYTGNQIQLISANKKSFRKNTQEKNKGNYLKKDLLIIKTKVISIDKLLKNNLLVSKKSLDFKSKTKKVQKSLDREKKLEEKPKGKGGFKLPSISLPATGFLDSIKRFLFWMVLGRLFFKYFNPDNLNKLTGIFRTIGKIGDFVEGTLSTVLSSLVNFIDFSYTKYDQVRKLVGQVGGKKGTEIFDKFSGALSTFVNSAIIIGILLSKSKKLPGVGKPKGGAPKGGTPKGGGPKGGSPKSNVNLRSYLGRDAQSKLIEKRYGNNAARIYDNARANGKSASAAKAAVDKAIKGGRIVAQDAGQGLAQRGGSSLTRRGLGKTAGRLGVRALGKGGVGGAIKGISKGFGRIPLIGPIVDFLVSVFVFKEKPGRAAAGAVGNAVGSAIGGALGTLIPIPFAGTWLGATGGGILGDILGRSLYDAMASAPQDEGEDVQKAATGGYVNTRGGRREVSGARTLRLSKIKTPPKKYTPEKTFPGKNVGGLKQIEKLYPNPKPTFGDKSHKPNALEALKKTSEILKKTKFIGALMGASVDIALGQKPSKKVYESIGNNIAYLVSESADRQAAASMSNLTRAIAGMADGGVVPNTSSTILNPKAQGEILSRAISNTIGKQVNEALNMVKKEVLRGATGRDEMLQQNQRPGGAPTGGAPGGGGGAGDHTDVSKISLGSFTDEDIDVLGRMIAAEAGNQSKEGKSAVMAVILNRYRLAKDGKGYLPRGVSKKNVTIKDIIYAPNQFSPIKDGRFDRTSSAAGKNALSDAISSGGNDPEKFKKALIKSGLSESDANYVVTSTAFSNPASRTSRPFDTKEVTVGNHVFQESPYAKLRTPGASIPADIEREMSSVSSSKAKHLIVMSGGQGYRQVMKGESAPTDYLHHGDENIRGDLLVRDYGITPQVHGGSQMLEGEGAPLVVPFGMKAKAIIEGAHAVRFEDPKTGAIIARYHHLENVPTNINGKVLNGGTFIGTQGGRPGASSGYGGSSAVHTHLEGSEEWHKSFINTYAEGLDVTKTNLPKDQPSLSSNREYDVILPLDHHQGGMPAKSLWPNASLGASGRERDAQDPTAQIIKQRLEAKGLRVKIMKPEDYRTEDAYNKDLIKYSQTGSVVSSIHYDAPKSGGGIGFLARLGASPDKSDRDYASKLAPILQAMARQAGGDQGYGGIDTAGNITMKHTGPATASLIELGALVEQEKKYGKEFWKNPEFIKHLNEISDVTASSVQRRSSGKETPKRSIGEQAVLNKKPVIWNGRNWIPRTPQNTQALLKPSRKEKVKEGEQVIAKLKKEQQDEEKFRAKRPWWDKFGVFGGAARFNKKIEGGPVGNKYNHLQQYPSYSSSGGLIIARQKVYIKT